MLTCPSVCVRHQHDSWCSFLSWPFISLLLLLFLPSHYCTLERTHALLLYICMQDKQKATVGCNYMKMWQGGLLLLHQSSVTSLHFHCVSTPFRVSFSLLSSTFVFCGVLEIAFLIFRFLRSLPGCHVDSCLATKIGSPRPVPQREERETEWKNSQDENSW